MCHNTTPRSESKALKRERLRSTTEEKSYELAMEYKLSPEETSARQSLELVTELREENNLLKSQLRNMTHERDQALDMKYQTYDDVLAAQDELDKQKKDKDSQIAQLEYEIADLIQMLEDKDNALVSIEKAISDPNFKVRVISDKQFNKAASAKTACDEDAKEGLGPRAGAVQLNTRRQPLLQEATQSQETLVTPVPNEQKELEELKRQIESHKKKKEEAAEQMKKLRSENKTLRSQMEAKEQTIQTFQAATRSLNKGLKVKGGEPSRGRGGGACRGRREGQI